MRPPVDCSDVPAVKTEALLIPMRRAIAEGRGLALLTGLKESTIRDLEHELWQHFANEPETRLAVALRFRALLDVFGQRRLKDLFLAQGFKLIARAIREAAQQRLNTRYGFCAQKFVIALATPPAARACVSIIAVRERAAA
jgi:hypothetical protein